MDFLEASNEIFNRFDKAWGLAAAGSLEDFDGCTIGWGSIGSLWGFVRQAKKIATIYVNPLRYTSKYLLDNDTFSISFFSKAFEKDLLTLGSKSKRDVDKFSLVGLTPEQHGDTVIFKEAELTLICRKLYWEQFNPSHVDPAIMKGLYEKTKQPTHYQFIGEIIEEIKA